MIYFKTVPDSSIMDTALPQKYPFILDRNLAKVNCTGNHVCTSCDIVVLGNGKYRSMTIELTLRKLELSAGKTWFSLQYEVHELIKHWWNLYSNLWNIYKHNYQIRLNSITIIKIEPTSIKTDKHFIRTKRK